MVKFYIKSVKNRKDKLYLSVETEKESYVLSCLLTVNKKFNSIKQRFANDYTANNLIEELEDCYQNGGSKEELKQIIEKQNTKFSKKEFINQYRLEPYIKWFDKFLIKKSHRKITSGTLELFKNYLFENTNLEDSTIKTYLRKTATKLKKYHKEKGIKIELEPVKIRVKTKVLVALTEEQLSLLFNYKDNFWADLFRLAYFTGARFSDWSRIVPEQIKDKELSFFTKKTNTKITIPLSNEIYDILNKYNFNIKQFGLLNDRFNYNLSRIAKEVGLTELTEISNSISKPLYELIKSHTFRRSRITNLIKAGTNPYTVIALSGHSSIKTLEGYIKLSSVDKVTALSAVL